VNRLSLSEDKEQRHLLKLGFQIEVSRQAIKEHAADAAIEMLKHPGFDEAYATSGLTIGESDG
jgi:hypothetical protein